MKFEVLMSVINKIMVFKEVTLCSLVGGRYQLFRGICCLKHWMEESNHLHALAALSIWYKCGWALEPVEPKLHAFIIITFDGGDL
jgi:hypothetical protein